MEHQFVANKLLEFVEGSLPENVRREVEAHLEQCIECRDIHNQYRSILNLEQAAAAIQPQLTDDLSGAVLAKIDRIERTDYIPRELRIKTRWVLGSLLSMNAVLVVILALLLRGGVSGPPDWLGQSVSLAAAGRGLLVPAAERSSSASDGALLGYRPLTLNLESAAGLDQLLSRDALVDIKCRYSEGGEKREAIVSQLVRVLGVNALNVADEARRKVTVTLLVPEGDARRVELARLLGDLSLSVITPRNPQEIAPKSESFTLYDPAGRPVTSDVSPNSVAVMYLADPKTGAQQRRIFKDGAWREEKAVELFAF